jgi:hypothetical protein
MWEGDGGGGEGNAEGADEEKARRGGSPRRKTKGGMLGEERGTSHAILSANFRGPDLPRLLRK